MVIQSNMPAQNAHRNLLINNGNLSRNLERLSSGFRINRAADDAAGLSISERMRTQIRGLAQAEMNTQNGIQLIQTAEGGLNETHAILQRMRELAVMSSNATFQPSDREQIHLEVVALIDEIDRIASSTHYNRISLLDGTFGSVELNAANITAGHGIGFTNADVNGLTLGGDDPALHSNELVGVTDMNARIIVTQLENMDGNASTTVGQVHTVALQVGDRTFRGDIGAAGAITFRNEDGLIVARITATDPLQAGVISGIRLNTTMPAAGAPAGGVAIAAQTSVQTVRRESNINVLTFQIGANGGLDQRSSLFVASMSASALGAVDINGASWTIRDLGRSTQTVGSTVAATEANPGVSILTQNGSNAAIAIIDAAVDQVSSQRAQFGALQNRLESTLNSLGVARENLTAAESTIRDVDMAAEMMRFTANNILSQASQAMLAQANQLPQGILQLLR